MAEDKTRVCVLFDIYGELLSPSVAESINLYYNDDLSLSEVAENTGISRQGVRDSLRRGIELLENFEQKLGLYEKYRENESTVGLVRSEIDSSALSDEAKERNNSLLGRLSF